MAGTVAGASPWTADEREVLAAAMLPVVRRLARSVAARVPVAYDDLLSEGLVGIARALNTFNPSRGASLATYVYRVAKGMMLNGARQLDPLPDGVRRDRREIDTARHAIYSRTGEKASEAAIAAVTGVSVRRQRQIAARDGFRAMLSLDAPFPQNAYEPSMGGDPLTDYCQTETARALGAAIASLPPRERLVLERHYVDGERVEAIAGDMGLSRQRVTQIRQAAIMRLRAVMADHAA